ncbi:AAA-ATPase 1 [Perilla frutescens var. hirtella]|nr:AAA-ATPase 1 [Perilla frutescens var. frutescens]KAH6801237.1 AAA-ATPase 1 [Perilla frutescens var. hirtella]
MMIPVRSMPETWGAVGSAVVTFIFFWDMFRRYCPPELRRYLEKCTTRLSGFLNPYIQISIHEYTGSHLRPHEAYNIVEAYLSVNSTDAKRLKAEMAKENDNKLMLSMDEYEKTTDEFNGVQVKWISGKVSPPPRTGSFSYYPEPDRRYYKLKFHKGYKKMITEAYLEHVITRGREIQARNRQRKLYTNGHSKSYWSHIVFEHPARFENLAMEPEKKEEIMDDLLTFTKSKDYYARIGKAWKRGYLLYGPPGTGKSTMIAAMANLLDYDVYDLELTSVKDNTELRKLLTETTAKSIIVIEDIDCSLDLTGQRKKKEEKPADEKTEKVEKRSSRKEKEESGSKVTLSGLLNFIDGLWSACAGERLIVFTTNYVDKLDPALTRRGRMDKHIELSYCKYEGFKVLAKNYLELEAHPLFQSVEELIQQVQITPADVAENLMPKSAKEGPEQCLRNLICTLEETKNKEITKCSEAKDTETNKDAAAPQEMHTM